jgi:hypothetical protein
VRKATEGDVTADTFGFLTCERRRPIMTSAGLPVPKAVRLLGASPSTLGSPSRQITLPDYG